MTATNDYRSALRRVIRWPARLAGGVHEPGRLIRQLSGDLRGWAQVARESAGAEFRTPGEGLRVLVRERMESQLLLRIVTAEFELCLPNASAHSGEVRVRHTGRLRRTGVEFAPLPRAPAPSMQFAQRLRSDAALTAALMPLDFTHCAINADTNGMQLTLRHYAASEVIGQLPHFRRYVRLNETQLEALLAVFRAVSRL